MLKKRSRAVSSSSKQSLQSPTGKYNRMASSSLFPSPRLFVGFSSKGFSDAEPAAMSPTSILETKPFSSIGNPFFSDRNPRKPVNETSSVPLESNKHHHPWDNGDSKAIGLGIIDALTNEKANDKSSKQDSRMVLFGSQLKIQVPSSIHSSSISRNCSVESTNSPIEFGIKTKDSQLALYSPPPPATPRVISGCFSPRDMELSEDYTCIISHGPNPKTTHIFDNCIVESCGDGFLQSMADRTAYPSDDFLSFCYACKKNLGHGKDIFMYGGEKAFCSRECRYQEMLFDEEVTDKSLAEQMRPL